MSLSPKKRFLEQSALVRIHQDVVSSEAFLSAAESALLQLVAESPDTTDAGTSIAAYHRIIGARQYLDKLISIADQPKLPEKRVVAGQLDHKA